MAERTELQLRQAIAYDIIADLVCCDIFERLEALDPDGAKWKALHHSSDYHAICHYGAWAAHIAEHGLGYCGETSIEEVDRWVRER